ncbi:hypothetical protein [Thermococcus sp.]|uniref:hypothetical protein n=1 Tax=Thermococcus sp. TaxID=35749 RepID=UPI00262BA4B7|nr:hypothetical protein [Thermococcus sp.]
MRKFSIERKLVVKATIAGFLVLALLFSAYSVTAYKKSPETTKVTYRTLYTERGDMSHAGFFSDESVYRNGTSLENYPGKITRRIEGVYRYSINPGTAGSYRAVLRTDYYVVSGKKRISLMNRTWGSWSGRFSGSFSLPVSFNVSSLEKGLKEIREGTGLYRASGDTYLLVEVDIPGRETFTHRVSLSTNGLGMLSLKDTSKDYKKVERYSKILDNRLGFAGGSVSVSTGRKLFPLMAILFVLPPLGFLHKRGGKREEMSSLRKFIVEGTPSEAEMVSVALGSVEDLGKVFDLVDKPIVHYVEGDRDVYAILDGEVAYEYLKERKAGDRG